MGDDKYRDDLLRDSVQRFEPKLTEQLQKFNLPGACLWELCFIVARLRGENKNSPEPDGSIEKQLRKVADLAGELKLEINALGTGVAMALSFRMSAQDKYSKLLEQGGAVPVTVEMISALPVLENSLGIFGAAVLEEIEQMKAQRGGKKAAKVPVQKLHAWYVKQIAKQLECQKEIRVGHGKNFAEVCTAVFECAGVTAKPVGAIKAYLDTLKFADTKLPAGVASVVKHKTK